MENAAIRSPQNPASTHPVARNAAARQAAAGDAAGGFSLLLADMAAPGALALGGAGTGEDPLAGAEQPLAALPADALTSVDGMAEAGLFSLASLVGQTARMDGAADAAQRDGRNLPEAEGDGEGLRRSVALPMGAAQPATSAQLPAWAASQARGKVAAADASDAPLKQRLEVNAFDVSSIQSLTPSERGPQHHALAALLAQMTPESQPLPGALASAGLPGLAAAGSSQASGAAPGTGVGGADSASHAVAAEATPADIAADAAAVDAVLAQPDDAFVDQLSEQVAFWVQQKTQRAEMTIDRQGQPVQVQVVITGNEAHVTFRSNEQQTRDMLDASTTQLREMLEQQGLSLAGVTVQTGDAGGQGGSSGGDPAARHADARANEGQPQIAQVAVDLRARPDGSRSVDLFV